MHTPSQRRRRDRVRVCADGGSEFTADRHRILRAVIDALRQHPIVTNARGHPPATFTEVRATLAIGRWDHAAEAATLRVTWQPTEPPEFAFHYSEAEFDCGWHREPNPHIDGDTHYQERTGDGAYQYEPITLDGDTAPELVWEIMERLRRRLAER